MVAIEKTEEGNPGFVAIEALDSLSKPEIVDCAKRHLHPDAICHTDAFPSLKGLAIHTTHIAKITPPEEADHWLPWVHVVISNLERFLLGTYQGAVRPHRLQEDIDEFVYRFNGGSGNRRSQIVSFVCASRLCPSPSVEHELSTDPCHVIPLPPSNSPRTDFCDTLLRRVYGGCRKRVPPGIKLRRAKLR